MNVREHRRGNQKWILIFIFILSSFRDGVIKNESWSLYLYYLHLGMGQSKMNLDLYIYIIVISDVMSVSISTQNDVQFVFISSCLSGIMFYLRYLCLFVHSGDQHILCCFFFVFFSFVLCSLCSQIVAYGPCRIDVYGIKK